MCEEEEEEEKEKGEEEGEPLCVYADQLGKPPETGVTGDAFWRARRRGRRGGVRRRRWSAR